MTRIFGVPAPVELGHHRSSVLTGGWMPQPRREGSLVSSTREYSDKFNGIRTSRQFYLLLWELVRDSGVNRKTIGTALSRVCWNDLDSEFVRLANLAGASTIDISSYRWTAESNAFKKGFSDFVFQWFKGFQGKEHGCTLERRWFLYYYVSLFDKKILRSHRIPILNPSFGHTFGFLSL